MFGFVAQFQLSNVMDIHIFTILLKVGFCSK